MNVFKLLSFGVIFYAAIDNQHLFPIVGIAFLPHTNSHLYWRAQIIGKFPFLLYSGEVGSNCKESACNAGDMGLIPGLGKSPEVGNDNLLQYSCLEYSIDR